MVSLGEVAYVNKLTFDELIPANDELPKRKRIYLAGYFNNIYSAGSGAVMYMEWTNKTAIGGGEYITPMTFPFKVKLLTSTYCWLSLTAMLLTGTERGDITIGTYVAGAGGVSNNGNYTSKGLIHQFTSADNNTYPKQVVDNSASGYEFAAGDSICVRSQENGTITPTNSELQVGLVFEIIP